MRNLKMLEQSKRLFFTIDDIRQILGLTPPATRLFCNRASIRGDLIRVRRGLYLLSNYELVYKEADYFKLANIIQTPSYISLLTALAYYNISTQIPVSTVESICLTRTVEYSAGKRRFSYFQTGRKYYFAFDDISGSFIAKPEKAIIDVANLITFGKYSLDLSSIDFNKFDFGIIEKCLELYSLRTKNLIMKWREKYGST